MSEGLLVGDTGAGVPLPESQSSAGSFSGDDADWDTTPLLSPFAPVWERSSWSGAVTGSAKASQAHAAGEALLDYSTPDTPVLVSGGTYAVTVFHLVTSGTSGDRVNLRVEEGPAGTPSFACFAESDVSGAGQTSMSISLVAVMAAGDALRVWLASTLGWASANGEMLVVRLA